MSAAPHASPPDAPPSRTSTPRSELERRAWPVLDDGVRQVLRGAGEERAIARGDVLFEVGQGGYDLVLIEEGAVEVVDRADGHVVITIEAPNFLGELGMLTGQGTFLAAVAAGPGRVLVVPRAKLAELVATVPEVADAIVTAFAARRRLLIEWGEGGLVIVGRPGDARAVALMGFAGRNRIPYRLVDPDDAEALAGAAAACGLARASLAEAAGDGPLVVTGRARVLRDPTPRTMAEALGLDLAADKSGVFDLAVVGAGPAGLAAAVYGASEGLSTLVIEDTAIGGQAGTSSRIENYLGFSTGVSGTELAYQGEIQAVKFGARLNMPRRAQGLEEADGHLRLALDDGSTACARAVVLACGVQYRKLPLDRLEAFEGAGIYYAATELEARFCRGTDAVIVGGGNSAGQAAMFLSRHARCTRVVVRGEGLAETMSSYLSDRIEADERIALVPGTEVSALHGEDRLEAVTLRKLATGEETRVETRALFIMIGAAPNTGWLEGSLALAKGGFVETGHGGDPYATSRAGVWAVGDVRADSVKRVASAVGEGSVVVAAVHRFLEARRREGEAGAGGPPGGVVSEADEAAPMPRG